MRPFDVARRFFHRLEWEQRGDDDDVDDDDNDHDDVDDDDNDHDDVAFGDKDEDALPSHGCEFSLTR